MERVRQQDLRTLLDFLQGCYAPRDLDGFVAYLIRALPQVVRSEITTYNEVNLREQQITWVWEPASALNLSDAGAIFERHIAEHPLISHFQQTRDGRVVKIFDFLSRSQFHRLGLYNEFYRQLGVEDQMAVQLAAPPPMLIAVALNRGRRDFSERDRLLLNLLRPHLAQAYGNAKTMTRMQREAALLSEALEVSGQGMVALSKKGRVRRMTPRARQWLEEYFGRPSPPATRLPEPLRSWVTQAHLGEADDVPSARTPFVSERDGKRLVVRHLDDAEACHLVLEEQPTAREPASLEPLGLTRREAEVLRWVAEGKTNAEIGVILGTRLRTVKKHLEHIYDKLGVETLTAAATLPCDRARVGRLLRAAALPLVVSLLVQRTDSALAAQAEEAEEPMAEQAPLVLQEVTVRERREPDYQTPSATTATKLETPILQTPVSIQVVPRTVMDDQQVIELKEALKNVSGVQPAFGFGSLFNGFTIRGFTSPLLTISLFRNGARRRANEFETANVERIEVVKGPAAVLYGRLDPGGVVNLVTKRPEPEPAYSAQQQIGSFGLYRTVLDATGPVTADRSLLYRTTLTYQQSGSFRDFEGLERIFLAPSLIWSPSSRTEVHLNLEYKKDNLVTSYGIPAIGTRPAPVPISRFLGDRTDDDGRFDHADSDNVLLELG